VRGGGAKSRPRLLQVALKGGNPREQPAVGILNTCWPSGTLARVKTQEPRLRRAGPTASADGNQRRVKRYVGPSGPDNGSGTLREEKAPKGESQERCRCEIKPARVTKGVSRQEGSQTLKAERGGQANAREKRTFEPSSAVGTESPREVLIGCGRSARCGWVTLSREAKLDEWISLCCLTVASVVRAGKTTQPREGPTAQWDRQTSSGDT